MHKRWAEFDLKWKIIKSQSENSDFNLLCPTDNFPTFDDEFEGQEIVLERDKFLKLLTKLESQYQMMTKTYHGIFYILPKRLEEIS